MKCFRGFVLAAVASLLPSVADASLDDGLVARYDFSGSAADSSGKSNDGTVSGPILISDRFGNADSAYHFDGVDDFIQIPESDAFDSTAFSISLWFRAHAFPTEAGMLISKGQNNFEIHTGAVEFTGPSAMKFLPRFVALGVAMDWHTPAEVYEIDEWTHVVGVYDPGKEIRFYVDGVESALSGPANLLDAPDNLLNARLGMRTDNTLPFDGDIDDVRIYNRVLTPDEVGQLHSLPEPSGIALCSVAAVCLGVLRMRRRAPRG